jgi:hypothetical protein
MPSFKEDIEEFMKLPYEQVISSIPVNGSIKDYRNDLWVKTFPWKVKKDNIFDFYSSDQYAASLFKEAVDMMEARTHAMTQLLADTVVKYEVVELPNGIITDPRILYYGCGNAMMLFELIGMNKCQASMASSTG